MARRKLRPFSCPVCGNGSLVEVEVEESFITEAKRIPAMMTTSCRGGHTLVLFVDANFQIRDVEAAVQASEKDLIDKTKDWFDSL